MTVILTPGYAPLEQYGESEDQQGPWTDLYAFGATLFHCLTGRPPRDAAWRIQASAHGVPDSIREALNPPTPLCSPEMVDLLCWMLMPLAKDRPQNCDQVAVRLYEMSKSPAGATIGGNMRSNPGHAISSATLSEVPRTEQAHPESRYYADGAGPATRFPTTSSNTDRASSGVPSTSSAPSASSIAPADAAAVEHALTEHLGPIARVLVKKAIAKATSRQDFVDGLAAEIDDISDREHFLAALKK